MPLRFVRQLRNNTAQSLVLIVKLGTYSLVALRLEVPSLKKHIPLISALRMSVRSVKATPRLPHHYVPRNDIRNIPLAHAVRLTTLVDRRSQRKIRHCDDDNKLVYCHKSHLNFALLIAPIIFAIISNRYKTTTTISQIIGLMFYRLITVTRRQAEP